MGWKSTLTRFTFSIVLFLFGLVLAAPAQAQTGTIAGTVTDSTGQTLPGVNVSVEGTQLGSATGPEGEYNISGVEPGTYTVRASFVGFSDAVQEGVQVRSGETTTVDFVMRSAAAELEEVVVVGYGTKMKKKSLTGSVSSVDAEDLGEVNASTVSDALAGKVAGVNFRKPNGRPGSGTQLQIRNMGNPLYVIDGVPKDAGQFNNLDYNDIASISILKDAAAASIYGMRAANGVVVVETKTGSQGQDIRVNFDAYYGLQDFTRFPRPADAPTFYEARAQAEVNQTGATGRTMEELQKYQQEAAGYPSTNWLEFATSEAPAPQSYVDISATGGSSNSNFYVSVSRLEENSIFRGFNENGAPFSRTNLQLNVDAQPVENLTVGARLNGRIENREHPGLPGLDDYFAPLWGTFNQWPIYRPFANGNPEYPNTTNNINSSHAVNTYETSGYTSDEWRVVNPQVSLDYEIIEGLTASGSYTYYYATQNRNVFEYTYDTYTYDEETDTYNVTGGNQNPYRRREDRDIEEHNMQAQLSLDRTFGVHNITSDFVVEANERTDHFWANKSSPSTNVIDLISYDELDIVDDSETNESRLGFALRTNYNYDDRYLLAVAGRYDGSYKFAPDERWGLFPSVSAGWRIANESFYEGTGLSEVLTSFKIRASYGQTGDDDFNGPAGGDGLDDFRYLGGYNYNVDGTVLDGQPVTGIVPRDRPQGAVSWLTSTMTNVGIDFGLWDDKLSGTVEAFQREREGLLAERYDVLVPTEVDVTVGQENLNADAIRGLEGSLQFTNAWGDLQYTLGGNATYARTYTTDVYKPRFANSWDEYRNGTEGRYTDISWGYQVIGQFQSQEEINNYPVDIDGQNNTTLLPGDFKYKDVNGDGVITGLDQRPIGHGNNFGPLDSPILNFGLNGSFQYKGADLKFGFTGASGFTYTRRFEGRIPFQANGNIPAYMFEQSWQRASPFDPSSTEWESGKYPPIRHTPYGHSSWDDSDFWTTNVTFLRLRNLELGYTLPESLTGPLGARNLRIYARTRNLFSIDNMRQFELDPESAGTGNSGNAIGYPQSQEFTIGANLSF